MPNAPDNDNERAIAITLLRDRIARKSLLDVERTIERMVDVAIKNPNSQLARDFRAVGILPPRGKP
jgi:hypothetical protein